MILIDFSNTDNRDAFILAIITIRYYVYSVGSENCFSVGSKNINHTVRNIHRNNLTNIDGDID